MLKKKFLLLLIPIAALAFFSYTSITQSEKETTIDQFIVQLINTAHYEPKEINDDFSKKVYTHYIERLDYNKKFLIQEDLDILKKHELTIDNNLNNGTFTFFNQSYDIITKRVEEAQEYYTKILKRSFDFTVEESLELDADKKKYAQTKKELKNSWRKSLKYQTLSRIAEMDEKQKKAKEKSDTVVIKSFKKLEIEARAKVLKSHNNWFNRLLKLNRKDRIATYFNAMSTIFDPHTEYYAPKDKENFDIGMSGQLEGIGAQLQEKDGSIKVTKIVPGSASWRQGELKAGYVITKVAQGADEPVDISDMRLDYAVQLIRGKKGTEVRLTVKKPDGTTSVITITRDIVVMEEAFAKSLILKGKKNVGYIKLPSFYTDFNGKGGHRCSEDVRLEIEKLKKENVGGIILDLRNNGGGSLSDVVKMAGLFIKSGPIVQVKKRTGTIKVLKDIDSDINYDGPLIIMVNSNSASASEIMAAAIQDYKRGVIVGTSQATFGKGTVQQFFNLDNYLSEKYNSIKPLGAIKITTQKFYRINGDATQLKGVVPDIILPDPYYLLEQGEKEQDFPIAFDEIPATEYQKVQEAYSLDSLKMNSSNRIKADSSFVLLNEVAIRLKSQEDSTAVSLNYKKYIIEKEKSKVESEKLKALKKEILGMEIIALKSTAVPIEGDTLKATQQKKWFENVKKDLYLHETLTIMNEM